MHLMHTPRPNYLKPAAVHEDRHSLGGCHSFVRSFCVLSTLRDTSFCHRAHREHKGNMCIIMLSVAFVFCVASGLFSPTYNI